MGFEEFLMSEAFQNLLSTVLITVATIATALIGMGGRALLAYLQTKTDDATLGILKETAATVVRALAQSPATELLDAAAKKEMALIWLAQQAEKMNLPVDYEFLDKVVEEAVQIMKAEGAVLWAEIPDYQPGD